VECPARVAQARGARTVAARRRRRRRRRLVVCRGSPTCCPPLYLRGLADGARGLRSARRRRLEQRESSLSCVLEPEE
jgi:hypothetical protein